MSLSLSTPNDKKFIAQGSIKINFDWTKLLTSVQLIKFIYPENRGRDTDNHNVALFDETQIDFYSSTCIGDYR